MAFECDYGACIDERLRCDGRVDCVDGSDEINECSPPRGSTSQTPSCSENEFQCRNGQCISGYDKCDGKPNCGDKSDETYDVCKDFECPPRSFKCNYGACVDTSLKCDGKPDCDDGSDEQADCPTNPSTTNTQIPGKLSLTPDASSCKLPAQPENGIYVSTALECTNNPRTEACRNVPGTIVPSNWAIMYTCNDGYNLSQNSHYSTCESGGKWQNPIVCIKLCPPLKSTSVNVKCYYQGKEVNCNTSMKADTQATAECKPNYKQIVWPEYRTLWCLKDGKWSYPLFYCVAECGVQSGAPMNDLDRITNGIAVGSGELPWITGLYYYLDSSNLWEQRCGGTLITSHILNIPQWRTHYCCFCTDCGLSSIPTPLISNGKNTTAKTVPWLAAIYRRLDQKWDQQCGGTLITTHIVVTAAHCLVKSPTENVLLDRTEIKVGLGKYFRSYYEYEGSAIISDVKDLVIPHDYTGQGSLYVLDIGLVNLANSVQVSANIMPACVDWSGAFKPDPGDVGLVAGWGKTEEGGNSSPVLLSAQLKFINYTRCLKQLPGGLKQSLTFDKFCAGDTDGSRVQRGDSGGGLTFLNEDKYFLIGVVSTKVAEYQFFTDITNVVHTTWLDKEKTKFVHSLDEL